MADQQGVVAVIVFPDGRQVCSHSEFETGYCNNVRDDLQRHQQQVAELRVKRKFWSRATAQWFRDAEPNEYFLQQFWDLAQQAGYQLHVIPVNHGDEHE